MISSGSTSSVPIGSADPLMHLRAAVAALAVIGLFIGAGVAASRYLETRYIHGVAPVLFTLKNQGVAFQKAAFSQSNLLPLYGSSELVREVPDKASRFFRHYPSDFGVFPIGKAGTTPLLILQKLGASGPEADGKKVVISLSPSWFFSEKVNPGHYAGNFSALQAGEFIFNRHLSPELRRDAASRMLEFPKTLVKEPQLDFAMRHLVGTGMLNRLLFEAGSLACSVNQAVGRTQDHFQSALYIWTNHVRSSTGHRPEFLDWTQLLAKASKRTAALPLENARPDPGWDELLREGELSFTRTLENTQEWVDLELLLRGMRELHMRPLVFTMPMNGSYLDQMGISPGARAAYYERLHVLAARYEAPVVDFHDHEEDPKFFVDHHDHLSARGWIYYDEVIDAFFHNRLDLPGVPQHAPSPL